MKNSVLLKIPANKSFFNIIKSTITHLSQDIHFSQKGTDALISATQELFSNALIHAYQGKDGFVEIVFHSFAYGLRIDVHDWGMPMAPFKYSSVPIDLPNDEGFNKIYKLVDRFEYFNLGKNGKKFSIIKYLNHNTLAKSLTAIPNNQNNLKNFKQATIKTRNFQAGDEEAIAKLIYQNYGNSYVKDLFYYPKKIIALQNKKIFSIIALHHDKIVGHFALAKADDSNIAEIGVVVVHPQYKGLGIMNKMFDTLLKRAQELKLDAIFGEAIMYHIFSQKSNLTHGFFESALMLGKAPADVSIENNDLSKKMRRGSVLIGYKIFHYPKQELIFPKIYKDKILKTYQNANLSISFAQNKVVTQKKDIHLYYKYDPMENIATIVIDHYGKHFKHKFLLLLNQLRSRHCDMIYAQINLNNIPQIDKVVKLLNQRGFFYSGVLFLAHKNQDYLCLQHKLTLHVGKKNIVCYSPFCHALLDYISKDEQRIK